MTQFRRPPAVHFPLAHKEVPALAFGLMVLAAGIWLLVWRWQQDFSSLSRLALWGLAVGWLVLVARLGHKLLQGLAQGALIWDGGHWRVCAWDEARALHALPSWQCKCTLDLQSAMLLRLEPTAASGAVAVPLPVRRMCWAWVSRDAEPSRWQALRQAVVWSHKHAQAAASTESAA